MPKAPILAFVAFLAAAGLAHAQNAPATPPCSTPEYRQLDFWVGDWDATFDLGGGKTGHAVNRITKDEYGACVIAEHFEQADIAYLGHSVSMYDSQGKVWRQTWVDNQSGYIALKGGPVTGQAHTFELDTIRNADTARFTRMIWEDVKPDSFTWRWQQRVKETDPWTDNWVIHYTRRKG